MKFFPEDLSAAKSQAVCTMESALSLLNTVSLLLLVAVLYSLANYVLRIKYDHRETPVIKQPFHILVISLAYYYRAHSTTADLGDWT